VATAFHAKATPGAAPGQDFKEKKFPAIRCIAINIVYIWIVLSHMRELESRWGIRLLAEESLAPPGCTPHPAARVY
jgi:hypothetical protein